ncbi:MAG: hypothetical protein IAB19_07440 [Proteobacteria bacterium]|uniref:Uncharacterized protein n=1 Tax=Candidatus Avisuccinivibrio stercorigallinarum TaxID=2840704 RepID=A0A9D9DD43_9GAMM|nr:hypothetical protein [Candidatus Avisuccinivibrio stercorigallinarum]
MQTITLVELQSRLDHLDASKDLTVRYEPVSRPQPAVDEELRYINFGKAELLLASADVFFRADLKGGIELEVCWQADYYGNKTLKRPVSPQYVLRGAELDSDSLEELKLPRAMQSSAVSESKVCGACGFEYLRDLDKEIKPLSRDKFIDLLPEGRKNNKPERIICHDFGKRPDLIFSGVLVAQGGPRVGEKFGKVSYMDVYLMLDGRYFASLLDEKPANFRTLSYGTGAVCEDLEDVKKFYGPDRMENLNLFPLEKIDRKEHTFLLTVDNQPDLQFTGSRITAVSSCKGELDRRWTDLHLYRTRGGTFVCHRVGKSTFTGERTRYEGKVCKNIEEIIEFFGHSRLAKALFSTTNIRDVQTVD